MDPNRLTAIPSFSHLYEDEAKRLATFATETTPAVDRLRTLKRSRTLKRPRSADPAD